MRKKISVLVCFGLLFLLPIVLSAQEIMPLKEVKAGMKGYGETVYEGFKIEMFDVEIIGTVKFWIGTVATPVILAKLSGGPIGYPMDKTKVVAGMSGSPIYIDGKLIGAVAYSFGTIPLDAIAGISPIELMLNPYANKAGLPSGGQLKMLANQNLNPIPLVLKMPGPMVSFLKEKFSRMFPNDFNLLNQNFVFSSASQNGDGNQNDFPPLEPGSAVSVSWIKGDIDLAAVGTVTAIYGNQIYAFGHPFSNLGQVNFPFHPVRILTTFCDQIDSFKISAEEGQKEIGVITEDHYAGIKGILGKKAKMIPYRVSLEGCRGEKTVSCQIVRTPELTYQLLRMLVFWNLNDGYKEVDSKEFTERSLNTEMKIGFRDLPDLKINHIYNFQPKEGETEDIFAEDYAQTIGALTQVLWGRIPLEKYKNISFRFKFNETIEPFQVEEITTDKEAYRLGETMSISVVLSRMNGDKKEWYQLRDSIKIQVPINVRLENDGTATVGIEVGSGEEIFSGLPFADKQVDTVKLIENLNNLGNTQLWLKATFPTFDFGMVLDSLARWLKEVFFINPFSKKHSDSSGWIKIQSVKLDIIEPSNTKLVLQRLSLPEGVERAPVRGSASLSVEISIKLGLKSDKTGRTASSRLFFLVNPDRITIYSV